MTAQLLKVRLAAQVTGEGAKETLFKGIHEKEGYIKDLLFFFFLTQEQWEHVRNATKWRVYCESDDDCVIIAYDI